MTDEYPHHPQSPPRWMNPEPYLQRFLALTSELTALANAGQAEAHHCGDIDLDAFFVRLRERLAELEEDGQELLERGAAPTASEDDAASTWPGEPPPERASGRADDVVTEQSLESFPASDPPANY